MNSYSTPHDNDYALFRASFCSNRTAATTPDAYESIVCAGVSDTTPYPPFVIGLVLAIAFVILALVQKTLPVRSRIL